MDLDQERVEARARVRQAQEREARAWQAAHRPLIERATLTMRHRTARVVPDAAADARDDGLGGDPRGAVAG